MSPIYGDFHGLPPSILTTGTRDLLLSETVRAHRKLRRAGVEADLHVYEGLSHAQYLYDPTLTLPKEVFGEIARFFDARLRSEFATVPGRRGPKYRHPESLYARRESGPPTSRPRRSKDGRVPTVGVSP